MLEKSTMAHTTLTPKTIKMTEKPQLSTLPVNKWQNEPLRGEMLCWSQCSKQVTSLEEQTSTKGRTRQYNWVCPSYRPTY